jgi:hypothetical protein
VRAKVVELGLQDSVYFNTDTGVFLPVLAEASVLIRPTATDGDANSIREALSLGIPVVASDVVTRPKGCLLHRNRDIDDLESVTRHALSNSRKIESTPTARVDIETGERIALYVSRLKALADGNGKAA